MTWIPPQFLRPANLSTVSPVGVLLPMDKYDSTFIVGGEGDDTFACFVGGDHPFEAFRVRVAANWKGLAVENVEIQVDLGSAKSLDGGYLTAGSVVRSGSELQLAVRVKDGGFRDLRRVALATGLASASEDEAVAFLRWRAIVRDGNTVIPIVEVSVDAARCPE